MSYETGTRHPDDFTRLEVYRRVDGAENFIDQVRLLSDEILGKKATATMAFPGDEQFKIAGYPYGQEVNAGDLKFLYYSRRDIPESHSEARFASIKRVLRNGATPPKATRARSKNQVSKDSLSDELDMIAATFDVDTYKPIPLTFDSMYIDIHPGVRNGQYVYGLQPDFLSRTGKMILAQAYQVSDRIANESRGVAYPMGNTILGMEIISIRPMPADQIRKEQIFRSELKKLLPIAVELGPLIIN